MNENAIIAGGAAPVVGGILSTKQTTNDVFRCFMSFLVYLDIFYENNIIIIFFFRIWLGRYTYTTD